MSLSDFGGDIHFDVTVRFDIYIASYLDVVGLIVRRPFQTEVEQAHEVGSIQNWPVAYPERVSIGELTETLPPIPHLGLQVRSGRGGQALRRPFRPTV